MNKWDHLPNRDEVLDKIYDFLRLLSLKEPEEAQKMVNVGSMPKFRDALHYHMSDYSIMVFDDEQYMDLPDDFSINISDPDKLDENDINPRFSGSQMNLQPNETITVNVGFRNEILPVSIQFMIYELDQEYYLNLMKVERD